ncbi:MAG TPA: hypothetical protein V6C97_26805 [Oculatellaceae cyanobacterium]
MPRTVVKHSYCKGKRGVESARRHINYVAYRAGDEKDRENGARKFFDKNRDDIDVRDVKQRMFDTADPRGVSMHKLILSPGRQDVDIREYTREVMYELSREKGMTLDWKAVIHDNTEHIHAHVCLMAKSAEGKRVRLSPEDHQRMREIGDDYIYREFGIRRLVEREKEETRDVRDVLKGDEREFRLFIEKELPSPLLREDEKAPYRGKLDLYEPFDDSKEKEKKRDPDQDRLDYEKFDRDFKAGRDPDHSPTRYSSRQTVREVAGSMSEFHGDFNVNMEKQRLRDLLEKNPDMKESIEKELEALKDFAKENRPLNGRDLDRFLEGMDLSDSRRRDEDLPPMKGEFETALNPNQTTELGDAGNNQNSAGGASREESKDNLAGLAGIDTPNVRTDVIGGKSQGNKEEERERDDLI